MAEVSSDENRDLEAVQPYSMHVSSKYLDLTRRKLELTRLPRELDVEKNKQWTYGTPKKVLEPLVDFWLENYDWRSQETIFNRVLPQFRKTVKLPDSSPLRVHFVHKRSTNERAIPLLFCHGWPGSFLEVSKIISVLTEAPSTDSGTAPGVDISEATKGQIAFHVVAPSIPGFGFSDASSDENFGLKATADVFDVLMKQLGYDEYVAHGVDWGFQLCRSLAIHHPWSCVAIHTTNPYLRPPSLKSSPVSFLKYHAARLTGAKYAFCDFGYVPSDFINPSNPAGDSRGAETRHDLFASYSLCDSPSGLLAWLIDTLRLPASAHQTTASAASPWTPTDLLNWTMMQWLPGPEAGLRWLANAKTESVTLWDKYSAIPLGISCFRGNGRPHAEPDLEAGEARPAPAGTEDVVESEKAIEPAYECYSPSSPPLWAQVVQKLTWVKRHGRCAGRPGWEEAGETGLDMREWAGQLVREGWIKVAT